jgi:acyl-CoA synthetase (AMP-forming)/AMP-acid ligase II
VNITMLLEMAADGFGDRIAVGPATDVDGQALTYTALRTAAMAGARELTRHGGRATLAYLGTCGPAVPVAVFAAAYAGATYAPLNHRLPAQALTSLVTRVLPAVAIARPEDTPIAAEAGALSVLPVEDWLAACQSPGADENGAVRAPAEQEAPAVLLFTSGTSAEPKAIRLHHDNLLAYILGTVEFGCADRDEALLLAVPPFHIAGVASVLTSVYSGRRIVPLPAFSARAWLETALREGVTHAFVVPTMLARIVAALEEKPALRVPSLRHLAYGGARMPLPVLERALELFPEADFVNAYGLTETSSTIAVLGSQDHRQAAAGDPVARDRLGSVGHPLPGVEVRIVTEDGTGVATGERGELWLRGRQIAAVGAGAAVNSEGWFVTGDLASQDVGGYLYIHGRRDDTIIRGGENIAPGEVEDALIRHPDIAAACVVGLPDTEWGERVEAAVVARPGSRPDPVAVMAWLRDRIGSLKTPQRIHVVGALPMTPTGKIIRRQVRAELAE